ncbi:MAG TPA: YciI family protein [Segeticoccus sp.]|uniref:YciI family protein n=1 Tax=Segeticoccus sp. TaxID=2706531 RepID=UPI002D7E5084|nr:YciI family protein [Segeticoccus sp.]HET8600967.1 YciI family protein [Segeticoccus sp.]
MTRYAILIPTGEDRWAGASVEEKKQGYADHGEFARLLAERGHTMVGGAELTPSKETKVVRGSLDDVSVTEGPFAEAAEHLTGFYLVETNDPEDLLQVCGRLAQREQVLEVRRCVDPSERP